MTLIYLEMDINNIDRQSEQSNRGVRLSQFSLFGKFFLVHANTNLSLDLSSTGC